MIRMIRMCYETRKEVNNKLKEENISITKKAPKKDFIKKITFKKTIFLLFISLVMATGILSSHVMAEGSGEVADSHRVTVTLLNQDPDPVSPGNFVDLRFKFENYGLKEADNIDVRFMDSGPFSILSEPDRIQKVGTLTGRQVNVDGRIIKYRVKVSEDAPEGSSEARIEYRIDGGAWREPGAFSVSVEESTALLAIEKARTIPDKASPGSKSELLISLKNLAAKDIKDVRINLNLVRVMATTTSYSIEELPFSTIGSSNEMIISHIGSMSEKEASFILRTDASADIKTYKVPVSISYSDYSGNNYSITRYVSVTVEADPDLSVILDDSTIIRPGQKGKVSIKFVNKGINNIKFLDINLFPPDSVTLLSSPEVYVGNIDSDDYETAEFTMFVDNGAKKELNLPVEITYKDESNKEYSVEKNIILRLYGPEEASRLGLEQESSSTGIIITLLIVVVGIFLYRYVRKRKKKRQRQ